MKKIIKTAVILMVFGLMATACQKVKTTSLIGTYKLDGKSAYLSVSSEGDVDFDSNGVDDISYLDRAYGKLIPFDLTSQKQSYSYSYDVEGLSVGTNDNVKLKINFNFEKNGKEGIKCNVSYNSTATGNKSLTFTK